MEVKDKDGFPYRCYWEPRFEMWIWEKIPLSQKEEEELLKRKEERLRKEEKDDK